MRSAAGERGHSQSFEFSSICDSSKKPQQNPRLTLPEQAAASGWPGPGPGTSSWHQARGPAAPAGRAGAAAGASWLAVGPLLTEIPVTVIVTLLLLFYLIVTSQATGDYARDDNDDCVLLQGSTVTSSSCSLVKNFKFWRRTCQSDKAGHMERCELSRVTVIVLLGMPLTSPISLPVSH